MNHMNQEMRRIEVFSAGCAVCEETIQLLRSLACSSCEIEIHDMHKAEVAAKAKAYGVNSVPAVVINGKLAGCCTGRGVDLAALQREGLGVVD
jgi:glutaredoxin 3